jgi:hypothetical protein
MQEIEKKLNIVLKELSNLREEVQLARNDSSKFAFNLDKEIKESIRSAKNEIIKEMKKISN